MLKHNLHQGADNDLTALWGLETLSVIILSEDVNHTDICHIMIQ